MMGTKNYGLIISVVVLSFLSACQAEPNKDPASPSAHLSTKADSRQLSPQESPNILLIIVDDMGMADIGSFGGEIETPNLDKLAFNGARMTNFTVAPTCSPTRAMLFTGADSHRAGLGNMLEETSPNQKGKPGYEGFLNQRVVTVQELLKDNGYRTYLSGKWHLGDGDQAIPSARGFERSFSLISGGASHFQDMRPAYAPTPDVKASYFEDGKKLTSLPNSFEYSSQFYVDKMIEYLSEDNDSRKPFFGVLSFTAPHWPLQAPDKTIAKYQGRYESGYDVLLQKRFEKQKQLGVIPSSAKPNSYIWSDAENGVPWEQLSAEQKQSSSRAMEVYAAMIDQIDFHVGRLSSFLEQTNQLENTLIIFMSDNGAEAHDLDETWPKELFPKIRKTIDEAHDFSVENMGKPNSYVLYGRGWGRAGAPAYRLHKAFPTEGGMRVAAFVHFPQQIPANQIDERQYFVTDIAPTILELTGVESPAHYAGRPVYEVSGQSLLNQWRDPNLQMPNRVQVFELFGKRMVKSYPWKLVHMPLPYGNGQWQLFNLEDDLLESLDRSAENPEIVAKMRDYWDSYVKENGVILPDWVSGY